MAYAFDLKRQLVLRTVLIPCAHLCRYCSISSRGEHRLARIGFDRFFALVDRFREWGATHDFAINQVVHNSDDITRDVAEFLEHHNDAIDGDATAPAEADVRISAASQLRIGIVRTGGARMRSDDAIRAWLDQWRAAGSTTVHASFAGHGEIHDWWNNREGDYAFLMRVQRVAVEMGLGISHTLFLMKDTLPTLQTVLGELDALGREPLHRYVLPVAYLGRATSKAAERQRLTEDGRDAFAQGELAARLGFEPTRWKSEREWIRHLREHGAQQPTAGLSLYVDETNIGMLESTPCGQIVDALQRRLETAYQALPSGETLLEQAGNAEGMRIYGGQDEIERLWLDRYLLHHDPGFERGLTHLR